MLFLNYKIHAPRENVIAHLSDNERLIAEEKIDTSNGKPKLHLRIDGDKIKIGCEMMGRATKDNGFLEGTWFRGKITENDGITSIKGIILTAPIQHFIMAALFVVFVIRCISLGAINFVPIFLVAFDIMMFSGEFKKQGIIKRLVFRALKLTYAEEQANLKRRSRISDNPEVENDI